MAVTIGINGFGRIGRCILRAALKSKDYNIVHINDLMTKETLAHLLKYDSVHGKLEENISITENHLSINGKEIFLSSEKNPENIPWDKTHVDVVLECTGLFIKKEDALKHLSEGGAKKVIVSAPGKGMDKTLVLGVNHFDYDSSIHHIVSNGSCTTNCLAPLVKVLNDNFGVVKGLMTTIHSYTNDQKVLDLPHKDLRRARAAALNMIPTSTGAAKAISDVIPELAGKLHGIAVRVPTPNVSLVDFNVELSKDVESEEINLAFQRASQGELSGILQVSDEPLVSSDYNGSPLSSIVDSTMTTVIGQRLVKVISWYDNETGFSHRMLELAKLL